jgi:hypothetical protein
MIVFSLNFFGRVAFALVHLLLGRMQGFDEVIKMVVSLLAREGPNILVGIVLVVVVIVCVEELFVIFAGLHLAAIAFFSEGEIEVVAFETDPVMGSGFLAGRGVRKPVLGW